MTDTFPKQVWTKLSSIDCSSHVEKKGQLSYLSWANAWTALMDVYPDSHYVLLDDSPYPDGTVEVRVSVTVSDGESELTRSMALPVMDYKNNAIPNPSSRDVSDARMRCLVKCIALLGLGLFLYRGEDIPSVPVPKPEIIPATQDQFDTINGMIKDGKMPEVTHNWLKVTRNWENLTRDQATQIIKKVMKESK